MILKIIYKTLNKKINIEKEIIKWKHGIKKI